ncbi:MAG: hypothetical protein WC868_04020 [Bacteroidales bacterium]
MGNGENSQMLFLMLFLMAVNALYLKGENSKACVVDESAQALFFINKDYILNILIFTVSYKTNKYVKRRIYITYHSV